MLQAAALYANVSVTGAGQSVRELGAVSGAVDRAGAKFSLLGVKAQGYGKGIRQIAGGIVKLGEVAAVGFIAATAASAKFATDFQSHMELIHTQAGQSQKAVDDFTVGVQNMVHEVGTRPDDLAKGLYHIASVGVKGAEALDILHASALGAKVGLADMESVTNALTAVWFSGITGAKSMTDAMAILDGIVGVGNMHLQDLTDSFKSGILGSAATFGVDIRSLGAAIATLTDAGVPADISATRLNMTLSHMAAPVPKAIKALKSLGIGQFQLANDLRKPDGIFVALKDLKDHLDAAGDIAANGKLTPQGADVMTRIFGGSRFGTTAMQLVTAMDRIPGKYDLILERSKTFGENVKATMATASFHWGQFIADVENDAISFGTGVLPGLISGLDKLDKFVVSHRQDAVTMGQEVGKAITGIGNALDGIDWTRFQAGFEAAKSVAQLALDVLKQVPPEVAVAFAGLVGIDKLSGGLLGKGGGNIVGTALGQFFGRGSAANPMWVRMLGGIPGVGPAGAAGAGSFLGKAANLVGKVFIVGMAAVAIKELLGVLSAQSAANVQAETDLTNKTGAFATGNSRADLQTALDGIEKYAYNLANAGGKTPLTPEGLAYQFNIDGVKDAVQAQEALLRGQLTYLARASAEGWGVQRTQNTHPTDLSASTMESMRGKMADALTKTEKVKDDRRAAIIADRLARGIKDTGPSTTLQPRFTFLAGGHKGSQDVAVAHALTVGFEQGMTPVWQSSKNIHQAIKVLTADERTLHGKDRTALEGYIARLRTELSRREKEGADKIKAAQQAAAQKIKEAQAAAGRDVAEAIKQKDMSVDVHPGAVTINIGGRAVASAIVAWSTRRKLRNS